MCLRDTHGGDRGLVTEPQCPPVWPGGFLLSTMARECICPRDMVISSPRPGQAGARWGPLNSPLSWAIHGYYMIRLYTFEYKTGVFFSLQVNGTLGTMDKPSGLIVNKYIQYLDILTIKQFYIVTCFLSQIYICIICRMSRIISVFITYFIVDLQQGAIFKQGIAVFVLSWLLYRVMLVTVWGGNTSSFQWVRAAQNGMKDFLLKHFSLSPLFFIR